MKLSTGLIVTIVVISVHLVDAFITPSDSEPECPGITCPLHKTIDKETCLCICQDNSKCQEDEKQSNSDWPGGQYALPASIFGCPEPDWNIRLIEITLQNNDIYWESKRYGRSERLLQRNQELHILGPFSNRSVQLNYCVQENTHTVKAWPNGNYCIYKTEDQCPPGFDRRNLVITKNSSSITAYGFLTRIVDSKHAEVSFCCKKHDNVTRQSTSIPDDSPFVLIKESFSKECPPYSDVVFEETVFLPKYLFNMGMSDMLFDLNTTESHVGLTFCSYHDLGDFLCNNNEILPLVLICDGFDNCGDNSDELYCKNFQKQLDDDLVTINKKRGIISSPLFPNNYPEEVRKTIRLDARKQFVKLTILYVSFARTYREKDMRKENSAYKDYITIDIGSGQLIKITSDNQDMYRHVTFISTTHKISITLSTYNHHILMTDKRYMMQYEKVDYPGCGVDYSSNDIECTARKAFIASHLYPSLFRISSYNVWKITRKPNQYIRLYFIDIDISIFDYLAVFDIHLEGGEQMKTLWSMNVTNALEFVESSWNMLKIIYRNNGGKLKGRGVLGRFEIVDFQFMKKNSSVGCPCGMYRFQQNCYFVEIKRNLVNQQHAEARCREYGGHLVSIDSKQEMEFIFDMCKGNSIVKILGRSVLIVTIEVFCIFKVSRTFVVIDELVSTNFIKQNKTGRKSHTKKEESLSYNCSQKVEITCYNKNIGSYGQNRDVLYNICKNGECKFLDVDWKELDVVFPLTDIITVNDPAILPISENNLQTDTPIFDDESFVYISPGPVICSKELPLTSMNSNIGTQDNSMWTMKRCIYDSESKLCRDMSHLHYCDEFVCPSGYFKCAQGFCLSSEFVCDGQNHCSDGKDEEQCEAMRCPGLFRCLYSTKCLTTEKVCDDIIDCPMADDELGCNMTCPDVCTCNGSAIVCHNTNVQDVYDTLNTNARKLDMSHSFFINRILSVPEIYFVGELICIHCDLKSIPSSSFVKLENLLFLDLSDNRLETIMNGTFHGLRRLRRLNLAENSLKTLTECAFVGLPSLRELNVSSNQIHTIEERALFALNSLITVNFMHNSITRFSAKIFSHLKKLEELSSDLFHFCCKLIKPNTVSACHISQQEEFSSCKDLIRNTTLRTSIWIVGLCSLFGNLGVMLYRQKRQSHRPHKAHDIYVLNLSISDMLMGIYLLMLAVADAIFKGDYVLNDIYWRDSHYCKLAGVVSTISSEASVTFIMFMTVDCFLKVRFPFTIRYHITIRRAINSSIMTWVVVAFLAILPILYKPYFADIFYSQTSVCLALPLSRRKTEGWEYSVAMFVIYNSAAFLVIAFLQINIYNAGKSSNRVMKTNTKQDFVLARRITMILVTDFLCWVPIGIMGIMSLQGYSFPSDVYAWVAVFVLPINSALNPFLYTFSEVLHQNLNKIKETVETIVFRFSMQNRRKIYQRFQLTIELCPHQGRRRRKLYLQMKSLDDVLKWKQMKPVEAYVLVFNIVQRVTYLHQHGYTFDDSISLEHVIVYLDKKRLVKAEVDLGIKKLACKSDSTKTLDEIGLLTRTILRKTEQ